MGLVVLGNITNFRWWTTTTLSSTVRTIQRGRSNASDDELQQVAMGGSYSTKQFIALPDHLPSSHSNNSCPLNAPGRFDPNGTFFLDDPSCHWVDYTGHVLTKTTDDTLTEEEARQKERLVGHSQQDDDGMNSPPQPIRRSILLIGDSQDRMTVEYFCGGTIPGAHLTVFPPRWSLPNGTIHSAPKPTLGNRNLHFRACRLGQLMIASFFHFGFTPGGKIIDGHSSEGEPWDVLERIENILPKYIDNVFGKDFEIDMVVINTGLWDVRAGLFLSNDPETLHQNISQWNVRANRVATSLEALIPTASILWRNLPFVRRTITKRRFTTFQDDVKLMNEIGVSFAESRHWPVLDLRGTLWPLGASVLQDDAHMNPIGRKLYLNRILNALVENDLQSSKGNR
jgi:hypothetical protein